MPAFFVIFQNTNSTAPPTSSSSGDSFTTLGTPSLRTLALVRAPLAFKRRNIFTHSVDLPLALRAGRPTKSA